MRFEIVRVTKLKYDGDVFSGTAPEIEFGERIETFEADYPAAARSAVAHRVTRDGYLETCGEAVCVWAEAGRIVALRAVE